MRTFIAVPVEKSLVPKILELQQKFAEFGRVLKFVEPQNLHFTLKFLGEIDEAKCEDVIKALTPLFSGQQSFEIGIKGLGCFPSCARARVVWLGIESGGEEFIELARKVENVLHAIGFPEERAYSPHLTIFRVKARPQEKFLGILNQLKRAEIGKMRVKKIIFYRSLLKPNGPEYKPLYEWKLE